MSYCFIASLSSPSVFLLHAPSRSSLGVLPSPASADYRPRPFDILLRRRGCALLVTMSDGTCVLAKLPRFENIERASRKGAVNIQVGLHRCVCVGV